MTAREFQQVAIEAYQYVKAASPYDTGNLRDNGIEMIKTSAKSYEIRIGGSVAPYAVFTNEKWLSPHWNNAHNPNEHWIDMAVQNIAKSIAVKLGGKLVSADGETERWENKAWRSSEEGQKTLKRYELI